MHFMVNHVGKANKNVVGMMSYFKGGPKLRVFFVKGKTEPQEIVDLITAEKLFIQYENGITEELDNPNTFK